MNIPCGIDPIGSLVVLPAGYTRIAYLEKKDGHRGSAVFNTFFTGSDDIGIRACGFSSATASNTSPTAWHIFVGRHSHWINLHYNASVRALGFGDGFRALYPQRNGLPEVTSGSMVSSGYSFDGEFFVEYNWLKNGKWKYQDLEKSLERDIPGMQEEESERFFYIFDRDTAGSSVWVGGVREVLFSRGERVVGHMVPVLNEQGLPGMWDLLRRIPLSKAGEDNFIVGIDTQEQLNNMLRKLPDRTGQEIGSLQVRLAAALRTPENEAKLDAMLEKNWEITQAA